MDRHHEPEVPAEEFEKKSFTLNDIVVGWDLINVLWHFFVVVLDIVDENKLVIYFIVLGCN